MLIWNMAQVKPYMTDVVLIMYAMAIHKGIGWDLRKKCIINTRRAKQTIHKAERQLLQDRVQAINSILQDNTLKLDRCRTWLASLVTSTTMDKCTNFVNKVKRIYIH